MADTTRTTPASPVLGTTAPIAPGDGKSANRKNESVSGALGDVKEIGTELAGAVRDSATSLFEEQRNRAADEIAALGEALRHSARSLDQSGGSVARYADQAAQQIGDFASMLRNRSWNQMAGDVEDFGRQWPLVFMAAAVGIGFAAGRFLMASAARSPGQPTAAASSATTTAPTRPGMSGTTGPTAGSGFGNARPGQGATANREIG